MSGWARSEAAARLRNVAGAPVGAPPSLRAVQQAAHARAARAARLLAFAVALPLGATAAAGGYVWQQRVTRAERPEPTRAATEWPKAPAPAPAPAQASALPEPVRVAAPAPVAATPRARVARGAGVAAVPVEAAPTPEVPALRGFGASSAAIEPARTSLADEAALLAEALGALRARHEPERALELLAQYRARFAAGTLRREAALATAEAHRALGHAADALAALDEAPRRAELDVLRAELLAELGRCGDARAALEGLVLEGALRERALFTDATCALSQGEPAEAKQQLEQAGSERARALLDQLQ